MVLDLALIGGTGVYDFPNLEQRREIPADTPFGPAAAPLVVGVWGSHQMVFLARHGRDHAMAPHQVNYRANMWAVAELKPRLVVAINAVGSLNPAMSPGALVVPDQIIDYTWGREHSYVGSHVEVPMHIDMTSPYSSAARAELLRAGEALVAADAATYGATQGPRLETAAEICRLRQDGCDLVGMTGMPEAALARELGLNYASVAMVANWAAGMGEGEIAMTEVRANIARAWQTVGTLLQRLLPS